MDDIQFGSGSGVGVTVKGGGGGRGGYGIMRTMDTNTTKIV